MRRRANLPGQLPLEFESSYLAWIDLRGETFDAYEKTTIKLFSQSTRLEAEIPVWGECHPTLNR
jgi:hypothetical protein